MRLLNAETLRLEYFQDLDAAPRYVILSHTWGDDEILFQDLDPAKNPEEGKLSTTKPSLEKVLGATRQALSDGFTYIWIDSCCIDKSSSAELSEAINSMFNWYARADECYAYLSDFTIGDDVALSFDHSRWFSRGWTLQELIAPGSLIFFDSRWSRVGTRTELALQLAARTKIPVSILNRQTAGFQYPGHRYVQLRRALDSFSVSSRMLWAEGRRTTRVEDRAYSLMGIFDVNMPLLYGEGPKAFRRLQEIILTQTNDQSILAFQPRLFQPSYLAEDAGQFVRGLETYQHIVTKPMAIVSGDIEVDVLLCSIDPQATAGSLYSRPNLSLAVLDCNIGSDILQRIAILLMAVNVGMKQFTRVCDDHCGLEIRPACFKLQPGDDGKTWAVSASDGTQVPGGLTIGKNVRLSISEFERTRIVIKPRGGMCSGPGKQVHPEFPLQISLLGSHSADCWFLRKHGDRYKMTNGYIRVDATPKATRLISMRSPAAWGAWDMFNTGIIHLTVHDLEESEGEDYPSIGEDSEGGFSIMWGYRFPTSKEPRTPNPQEGEMICYVFPRPRDQTERDRNFPYNMTYEFPTKAATVSSCWNNELGRTAKAEIWTKTVLDRTCSFLTVDVSDERDEDKASNEDEARDRGKAGDVGKADDEDRAGKESNASDDSRY